MARKRYTAKQIINKLREPEVLLVRGMRVPEVSHKLGVNVEKDADLSALILGDRVVEMHGPEALLEGLQAH